MRIGAERIDIDYVWPQTLRLPPRPPKLVYLDLNHWVSLAKAMAGHRDGSSYAEALAECLRAVDEGQAVFPISETIYFEISKLRQHRQRRDLRQVIERVSRFTVVTSRSVVSAHEIEAVLDRVVGRNPNPINTTDYLDWGVARAFGKVGGFKVRSIDGKDVTSEVRLSHPVGPEAFDLVLAKAELELNRRVLEGPTPEEEPNLRELGWDPTVAFQIAERRASQEVEQVGRFNADPRWRRGRIREVVAAREILIEINDWLYQALTDRGRSIEEMFACPDDTRRTFDAMPSFDVAVTLKTAYHRDPMHRWTPNDTHDIDALGSTLPYCDIVVTDKAVASIVRSTRLGDRLGTITLSRLADLMVHL